MHRQEKDSSLFFDRHRSFFTKEQWQTLRNSRFVVAGAGGLGSHVLDILIRLGAAFVEIWDPGILDGPDLNRQCLYDRHDLEKPKVFQACERLQKIHPDSMIAPVQERITPKSELGKTIGGMDICFDCLDSFSARADLAIAVSAAWQNRAQQGVLVHGGVSGFHGQVAVLSPPEFCYEDIFGPDFATIPAPAKPVMPHAVALVASTQIGEMLRVLRTEEKKKLRKMIVVDGYSSRNEVITIKK